MTPPRYTNSWQTKTQRDARLLADAWADSEILNAWEAASEAYSEWVRRLLVAPNDSEEARVGGIEKLNALVDLFKQRASSYAFICGSHLSSHLEALIRDLIGVPVPEGLADRLDHLGPDNPLEFNPMVPFGTMS